MKTSCISHPEREPLVVIRKSQIEFCDGNQCAAAVLSFLEYWHNWKLDSDAYNKKSNNIAEMHGDPRSLSEDVYQYHSLPEISDGIMNLYSTKVISEAIKLLESKGVVSTHKNPNPRYHYDKTKYFRLYPEVYNNWLRARETRCGKISVSIMQKDVCDKEKFPHANGKNAVPCSKNAAHTEINNKDNNQSLNAHDDFSTIYEKHINLDNPITEDIKPIMDALLKKGMSPKHFHYPDVIPILHRLQAHGATMTTFVEAYDIALAATQEQGFGIRYLARVIENILLHAKKHKIYPAHPPPNAENYEGRDYGNHDLRNLYWMDDSVDQEK